MKATSFQIVRVSWMTGVSAGCDAWLLLTLVKVKEVLGENVKSERRPPGVDTLDSSLNGLHKSVLA